MSNTTLCWSMETIKIKSVLASYFSTNKEKKDIDFKTLSKFKKSLENKFRENGKLTYIQYYRDDLILIAQNYGESFKVDFDSKKVKYLNDKNNIYLVNLISHKIKEDYNRFFLETNSEIN